MGAAGSSTGGLAAARELLIEKANEDENDALDVESVDMLLKKLGPGIQRARGDAMHFTCRNLSDMDVAALAALVVLQPLKCTEVVSINLSHNMLGDASAVALGEAMLTGAPSLRKLQLHENRIGSPGFAALTKAMRPGAAPGIECLRVAYNRIDDEGMLALADAFAEGGALQLLEVHVGGNDIGDAGLAAIAARLDSAPKLQSLAFGSSSTGNRVDDEGAKALVEALASSAARVGPLVINLKNQQMTGVGEAHLDSCSAPNVRITYSKQMYDGSSPGKQGVPDTPTSSPPPSRTNSEPNSRAITPPQTPSSLLEA